MNNILVKIHDSKQTLSEAVVTTKDGTPTTIKAVKYANYELIDQTTNFAPHHFVAKREAQDLHVAFEENGQASDLVIEGFYDVGDTGLMGLSEDNQYYYFIPDTANEADYVTELAVGDIEGQALGGVPHSTPWWVGEITGTASFVPWLVGLAGIGVVTSLRSDSKYNGSIVHDTPSNLSSSSGTQTNTLPTQADKVSPVLTSIAIPTTADKVELTYTEQLDTNVADLIKANLFEVHNNGQSITINGIKIDNDKITLSLASKLAQDKPVNVSYQDPTPEDDAIAVQDSTGNDVITLSGVLGVGVFLPTLDNNDTKTIDITTIGDFDMVDLSKIEGANLVNVTLENVNKGNHNGLFVKGDVGDTITLGSVLDTSTTVQADVVGSWKKGDTPRQGSGIAGDDSIYNVWTYDNDIMLYIDADMGVL